jgi:hypothetical protein
MANLFPKRANALPWKIAVCIAALLATITAGVTYYCTPKYTRVGYQPLQPIAFSHALHVKQLGLDCRYCHSFVETAAHADIPSTQTCMACHSQVRRDSPALAPLRDSWRTGLPVPWVQVHVLPDYVYFNHAAHVNRGVSCYDCHGLVSEMSVVSQQKPLSMAWCLDCHRHPENFLRPESAVFNMKWMPPAGESQWQLGERLKEQWDVAPPLSCGGCHR